MKYCPRVLQIGQLVGDPIRGSHVDGTNALCLHSYRSANAWHTHRIAPLALMLQQGEDAGRVVVDQYIYIYTYYNDIK